MNIATLGVAIDPTGATSGAAAAVTALNRVTQAAQQTTAATAATGRSTAAAAAQAGNTTAAAHQGVLSRMAQSLRSFFSSASSSAGQTQGIFTGMVGHIVSFLQSVLSMVPGATAAFAGMAGAAGSAATSLAGMAGGGAAAMAIIGPLVVALLALVAAFVALGVVGVLAWKGINAAAAMEKLEVQYGVLIGNVQKTKATMKELVEFADATPFDTKGVMQWGQEMLNAGIAAGDLKSVMHDVGNSALGDSAKMTTAVMVLTQSIGKMKADTMDLRQLGSAGIPIMEGLEKALGKNSQQILEMTEKGKIGFTELRAAFAALGGEGGRLGTMMDKMSQTWEGRMSTLASHWDTFLVEFGKPIKDALGPTLDELDKLLVSLIPRAAEVGKAIGDGLRIGIGLLKNGDLGTAIELQVKIGLAKGLIAGWNMLVKSFETGDLAKIQDEIFGGMEVDVENISIALQVGFKKAANIVGIAVDVAIEKLKNMWDTFPSWLGGTGGQSQTPQKTYMERLTYENSLVDNEYAVQRSNLQEKAKKYNMGGGGAPPVYDTPIEELNKNLEQWTTEFADLEKKADMVNPAKAGVDMSDLKEPAPRKIGPTGGGPGADADKFKGDNFVMEQLAKELAQMNALMGEGKMTQTEFGRRTETLKDKAAGDLQDPNKYQADLGAWRAYQAATARVSEATEARIKSGQATTSESLVSGINKAADAWGNAAQQMQKLGAGVANSISSNLTTALTSIVTGSKDAKTAFRDMAVAILNDIAKMIIQLLVEMAIRSAIKALSGFVGGGSVGGGAAAPAAPATAHMASGGPVWGGAGGIDDIPAMLTRGEYVIPKDAADHYGSRWLDQVRDKRVARFAAGGGVGPIATASSVKPTSQRAGDQYHFAINVQGGGGDDDGMGGGDQTARKARGEKLARQIEITARQVIRDEQRPGGTLHR